MTYFLIIMWCAVGLASSCTSTALNVPFGSMEDCRAAGADAQSQQSNSRTVNYICIKRPKFGPF